MPSRKLHSVLYVDDDPDICVVVQATLSVMAGLEVSCASGGELAIDLAYEVRPDLILMDVMMPGLDGPSTLKLMRENALIAHIPVVFLTAKVLPAELAHFLELGAIGVIGKPFNPVKLCDDLLALWNNANSALENSVSLQGEAEVRAQTSALSDSFIGRASGDVARLREMLKHATVEDPSVLKEIERVAHCIHGSAAIFGFPEVSACGGAIERLAESAQSIHDRANSVGLSDVLAQLTMRTERLAREIECAAGIGPRSGMLQAATAK